jgi:hypothetical protein
MSALGFRLIWSIPSSTHTQGRQSKIKAPPKVKIACGIVVYHEILLQISMKVVKKKRRRLRALNPELQGGVVIT